MESAPSAKGGFSPLDEQLALGPSSLSPHLLECAVRLGAVVASFREAAALLSLTTGTLFSAETLRRKTEEAGALGEALQQQQVSRLLSELPPSPEGPKQALMSADGAMVPLVKGEWAEVKTLVLGVLEEPQQAQGQPETKPQLKAQELSYFSRLTEADNFKTLALYETHRRGLEQAGEVAAVCDGAEWLQGLIDYHRADAVRILDFVHASQRIRDIAEALWGSEGSEWRKAQSKSLQEEGPEPLLQNLRELRKMHPDSEVLEKNLAYLEKRATQMCYPSYRELGYPIGSGSAESAHKQEVAVRLRGAGMRWQRHNVNPMLVLRNTLANDRWAQDWEAIQEARACRPRSSRKLSQPLAEIPPKREPAAAVGRCKASASRDTAARPAQSGPPEPYKPAANHPWRLDAIGRARSRPRLRRRPS